MQYEIREVCVRREYNNNNNDIIVTFDDTYDNKFTSIIVSYTHIVILLNSIGI